MPVDVLALGAVSLDEILYVENYPSADAKVRVLRRVESLGGLAGTALVAASRLGVQAAYAGMLGENEASTCVRGMLEAEQIDVSGVILRTGAGPSRSVIIISADPPARTVLSNPSFLRGAAPDAPSEGFITSTKVLLVDHVGVAGMVRAARIARRAGIPVVGDFERDDDPAFSQLLDLTDHLVISEHFAEIMAGIHDAAAAAQMLAGGRGVAVVTCGADGCWASEGKSARHFPAFEVRASDTNGCGDVFHGAYAAGLARGMDLPARITLASAAAALKAERGGGIDGVPRLQDVADFLALRGVSL